MPGAVLWIHGLGDTGAGWKGVLTRVAKEKPGTVFEHPTAPTQAVTCNSGARMTSWFDIEDIPVALNEPECPTDKHGAKGMQDTVASVHSMLEKIESTGIKAEHIVLGGFSQGGATSLQAGLSYPKKLAGVVSISGWCTKRSSMDWISEAGRTTPVLMSCGDGDPVVDISITRRSGELLQAHRPEGFNVMHPKRAMHPPDGKELAAVEDFIIRCLP
eukprot:TRINITY_DN64069_c0_g1_i1.p2 TRINITY_DN64069_c0_g1~~TRINITY_DN64069_c0_g1_i1.p2  ORF type:complete len:216 (+),score=43.73 TRINITY_DN64069_c0_g1_i1:53-700(+)